MHVTEKSDVALWKRPSPSRFFHRDFLPDLAKNPFIETLSENIDSPPHALALRSCAGHAKIGGDGGEEEGY